VTRRPGSDALQEVLAGAAEVVAAALAQVVDRRPSSEVPGQYALDVVTDAVVVPYLVGAGLGVLSEESGLHHGDRDVVVVVDPVDGSTNASRSLPWYACSLCAVDADGPVAARVVNLATGEVFSAERGRGARCDGVPLDGHPAARRLDEAIVGFNGLPTRHWGWSQARVLGAAALDLCAVAAGRLDGYVELVDGLAPWDYLAATLVCREAGAVVADAHGRPLEVLDPTARRAPVAAGTPELLEHLLAQRGADGGAS
jgi:fructose-1,6-bisphosphatase/inositol monophosphatase family enzyme